jgi:hypothetical protein
MHDQECEPSSICFPSRALSLHDGNHIKINRNTIHETTSDASPKQASRPLRLKHHQHEYGSRQIKNIGLVITTQDSLRPQGKTRTLPHNVTHYSAGLGAESSEVDEGRRVLPLIQSPSCSRSCSGE